MNRPGQNRERSWSFDDYLLIFPAPGRRAARDGIGTSRCTCAQAAVAGASSGRVPLPLWMSGTAPTLPGRRAAPRDRPRRAAVARQDGPVTTRIVYTDLDGTMVGPRG